VPIDELQDAKQLFAKVIAAYEEKATV
jgi:hypothetical protein